MSDYFQTYVSQQKKGVNQALNFIFALLMIHFLFFGFVCNTGDRFQQKDPGDKLLFLYTIYSSDLTYNVDGIYPPQWMTFIFNTPAWVALLILFAIGVIQAYREDLLVYAIKNNLWMVPLIILQSWIWYAMNYRENIFKVMWLYFSSPKGYINILVLLVIYVGAGIVGGWLHIYVYKRRKEIEKKAIMELHKKSNV